MFIVMPIKETGLPWVFIPSLSTTSKALLIAEMQLMVRYFTLAHGCKSNSYVFTYINEVKEKIKLSDLEYEHFIERLYCLSFQFMKLAISLSRIKTKTLL